MKLTKAIAFDLMEQYDCDEVLQNSVGMWSGEVWLGNYVKETEINSNGWRSKNTRCLRSFEPPKRPLAFAKDPEVQAKLDAMIEAKFPTKDEREVLYVKQDEADYDHNDVCNDIPCCDCEFDYIDTFENCTSLFRKKYKEVVITRSISREKS